MVGSDDLFVLIKSMSKTEKAYFKKFAYKSGESRNGVYSQLFDFIDNMTSYNEEEVRHKFSSQKNFNLPSAKNYLQKMVLKSLREFTSSNDENSILKNGLIECRLLFERGLKKIAMKQVKKLEKLASKREDFVAMQEVYVLKEKLIESGPQEYEQFEELYAESVALLEQTQEELTYTWLRKKIHLIIYSQMGGEAMTPEDVSKLNEFVTHPLLQDHAKPRSFRARYFFLSIWSYYYRAVMDYAKSLENREKTVRLFLDQPEYQDVYQGYFLGSMYNLMVMQILQRKFDGFEESINIVNQFYRQREGRLNNYIKTYFFTFHATALNKYLITCEFERAQKWILENESVILDNIQEMTPRKAHDLLWHCALHFFIVRDFDQSLKWLLLLENDGNSSYTNFSRYLACRMLLLLIHFELRNYQYLEHLIRVNQRILQKSTIPTDYEDLFLSGMSRVRKVADTKESRETFKDFFSRLEKHHEKTPRTGILDYFDFTAWVQSKFLNISLMETLPLRVNRVGKSSEKGFSG